MNVHDVARRAGADLRAEVGEDLGRDLRTGLTGVQWAHDRRRRRRGVAGSVLVTAALVGALAVLGPLGGTSAPEPAGPLAGSPSSSSTAQTGTLEPVVARLGPRDLLVTTGGTSFRVRLPEGFDARPATTSSSLAVDIYQKQGRAGVSLLPDTRPLGSTSTPDAGAVATWISTRPDLEASDVMPTRIGDRPAWRVDARLRHNAPAGTAGCNHGGQPQCWPLLETGASAWQTGVWADMVCSYYVLDGPDGKTVVVWAFSFDHTKEQLRLNDELVHSIRITAAGG